MGIKDAANKLTALLKKYRYVALVLLVGLGLMAIPTRESNEKETANVVTAQQNEELTVSQELAQILSQVSGAGEVRVLLTVEAGEQTVFQTDEDTSVNSESSSTQVSTVTVTNSDRDEYGLIRQINPPVYKGAIIVCQGADDPQIRLAIVNAVARVTGLGTDRISVLKMK